MSTNTQQVTSPYEAYQMMVEDYNKSRSGDVINTLEVSDDVDPLQELRGNLGYFAIEQVGLPLEIIANDISIDPELLLAELETDDRLIELTSETRQRFQNPETNRPESYFKADKKLIKWMTGNGEISLPTELVSSNELQYRFVDLTPLHSVTSSARELLKKQNKLEDLTNIVKLRMVPELEKDIKNGGKSRKFRPVQDIGNNDKDRTVKTDYPAYKFGINGPQNRAILLLLGKGEDEIPIYGLASICDHEDQDKVLRALSQDNR